MHAWRRDRAHHGKTPTQGCASLVHTGVTRVEASEGIALATMCPPGAHIVSTAIVHKRSCTPARRSAFEGRDQHTWQTAAAPQDGGRHWLSANRLRTEPTPRGPAPMTMARMMMTTHAIITCICGRPCATPWRIDCDERRNGRAGTRCRRRRTLMFFHHMIRRSCRDRFLKRMDESARSAGLGGAAPRATTAPFWTQPPRSAPRPGATGARTGPVLELLKPLAALDDLVNVGLHDVHHLGDLALDLADLVVALVRPAAAAAAAAPAAGRANGRHVGQVIVRVSVKAQPPLGARARPSQRTAPQRPPVALSAYDSPPLPLPSSRS